MFSTPSRSFSCSNSLLLFAAGGAGAAAAGAAGGGTGDVGVFVVEGGGCGDGGTGTDLWCANRFWLERSHGVRKQRLSHTRTTSGSASGSTADTLELARS